MKRRAILFASLILAAGASGCRTASSAEGTPKKEGPSRRERAAKQAPQPVPADSPLAKVTLGMHRDQVDELLGAPTSTRAFPSGKGFIPYYYGPDTTRTGAFYRGLGRITFSGTDKVVQIEYDPAEDGH